MSMNMIREKAVLNFLKRIQLVTPSEEGGLGLGLIMSVPGWLELRKGFYTYLAPCGELVIFRDGVVSPAIDEREREELKDANSIESSSVAMVDVMVGIQIGSWKIHSQEILEGSTQAECEDVLDESDVDEIIDFQNILNGQFCYAMEVPGEGAISLSLLHQSGGRSGKASVKPFGCPALWNLDSKLRAGLPLLVPPSPPTAEVKGKSNKTNDARESSRRYILKYLYSPQFEDQREDN